MKIFQIGKNKYFKLKMKIFQTVEYLKKEFEMKDLGKN